MSLRTISLSRGMRVGLPAVLMALWATTFLYRLFQTQVVNAEYYKSVAAANTSRERVQAPVRAPILMHDGSVAVTDAPRYDLLIRAGQITVTAITAEQVRNMVLHTLPGERGELRDTLVAALAEREPFVAEVAAAAGQERAAVARGLIEALEAVERRWVNGSTPQPLLEGIERERWLTIKARVTHPFFPPVSNWRAITAEIGSRRSYPQGTLAAAVLGTVKSLSGDEYGQLGRSGMAIRIYARRQEWYAGKLAALTPGQSVALGAAFGSLDSPPKPPQYIDEAVLLLRQRAAARTADPSLGGPTTIPIGNNLWDTAPGEGTDPLTDLLPQLELEPLFRIAEEPPVLELSEGEKIWVGAAGYGGVRRYLPQDTVGSMGVELTWNDRLRGRHGLIEEDRRPTVRRSPDGEIQEEGTASGPAQRTPPGCEGFTSAPLKLTLDSRWQQAAEKVLAADGVPGVVIAMDAHTGAVLCLAMYPTFDPSAFADRRNDEIRALMDDPNSPMLNRAIGGQYAPGSILKPVVSLGAMRAGVVTPGWSIFCDGAVRNSAGKYMIGCHGSAHGQTDCEHALKKSCNCYYHHLAQKWDIDDMSAWLKETGLGARTGIDLPYESVGFVPTREWKQRTWQERWLGIETSHVAIGQGALMVTPIQAAAQMALVANGGKVVRPHVVDEPGAERIVRDLQLKPEHVRVVHAGLSACVNEIGGTAYRTFHDGVRLPVTVAGKTGTADVKKDGEPRVNSWFSCYFPADKPEIVVVAVVPFAPPGASGGLVAGGVVRRVLEKVYIEPTPKDR